MSGPSPFILQYNSELYYNLFVLQGKSFKSPIISFLFTRYTTDLLISMNVVLKV